MYQGHKTKSEYIKAWRSHTDQLLHLYLASGDDYGTAHLKRDNMRTLINRAANKLEADGKFK